MSGVLFLPRLNQFLKSVMMKTVGFNCTEVCVGPLDSNTTTPSEAEVPLSHSSGITLVGPAIREVLATLPSQARLERGRTRASSSLNDTLSDEEFTCRVWQYVSEWSVVQCTNKTPWAGELIDPLSKAKLMIGLQHFFSEDVENICSSNGTGRNPLFNDSFDPKFNMNSQLWKDLTRNIYQISGVGYGGSEDCSCELFGEAFTKLIYEYCGELGPGVREDMVRCISTEMSQVSSL